TWRMRSRFWSTRTPMSSTWRRIWSSSSWKAWRRGTGASVVTTSPEPSGDVVLGPLVRRAGEDGLGAVELDQQAGAAVRLGVDLGRVEGGGVGDAGGLLHVVGHDHDRELVLDLLHQVLDAGGGDGVERRARLVHEQHVGPGGDGPGDAEPLLLAAGEPVGRLLHAVLDLVPQRRLGERRLHDLAQLGPAPTAQQAGAVGRVVVDRLRERVGLLEHHADAPPHLDGVDLRPVQRHPVIVDHTLGAGPGDEVVHAVEAAEDRRLPAGRGADEGGDLVVADVEVDLAHGPEVAVVDAEVADLEHDRQLLGVRGVVPVLRDRGALGQRGLLRLGVGRGGGGRVGHDALFFSKRLRRMMAIELTSRTKTSMAMMAGAVFGVLKSSLGSFAQVVMIVGMAVNRSVRLPGSSTLWALSPGDRPARPVSAPTRIS